MYIEWRFARMAVTTIERSQFTYNNRPFLVPGHLLGRYKQYRIPRSYMGGGVVSRRYLHNSKAISVEKKIGNIIMYYFRIQ